MDDIARTAFTAGHSLPEGSIREVLPGEKPAYLAHLLRLDPLSRYTRFGGFVAEPALVRHAERATGKGEVVLGYFVDGEMRGAAELHPLPSQDGRARTAEMALSVERAWQEKGIGSALTERLIERARGLGIDDLELVFQADNRRMKSIAIHHAAALSVEANEVTGTFAARPATPFSWLRRATADAFVILSTALRLQERLLAPALRGN